jgi:hypothetical protein
LGRDVIPLSKAQFIWYATLAQRRSVDVEGDGWVAVSDPEALWRTLRSCRQFFWSEEVQLKLLDHYMGLESAPGELKELDADSLTKLRTDTLRALKKFAKGRPRDLASRIIPTKKKTPAGHLQRIALEPERIELVGLDGW